MGSALRSYEDYSPQKHSHLIHHPAWLVLLSTKMLSLMRNLVASLFFPLFLLVGG